MSSGPVYPITGHFHFVFPNFLWFSYRTLFLNVLSNNLGYTILCIYYKCPLHCNLRNLHMMTFYVLQILLLYNLIFHHRQVWEFSINIFNFLRHYPKIASINKTMQCQTSINDCKKKKKTWILNLTIQENYLYFLDLEYIKERFYRSISNVKDILKPSVFKELEAADFHFQSDFGNEINSLKLRPICRQKFARNLKDTTYLSYESFSEVQTDVVLIKLFCKRNSYLFLKLKIIRSLELFLDIFQNKTVLQLTSKL